MPEEVLSFSLSSSSPADSVLCADLAVPLPVSGLFTYVIPEEFREKVRTGIRVIAPFKNREITGYVVSVAEKIRSPKLKSIFAVLDEEPILQPAMLELTRWIGEYYGSSWGEAIENALPKWIKYGKKAARSIEKYKQEKKLPVEETASFILTPDQSRAMEIISKSLLDPLPAPILLHGVTGSGKSELYIRAIRQVIAQGKSAICLVPEIALTEQLRLFFIRHFGEELEILHSKLSDGERFACWKRLETGERKVILGPRSAVFAPVPRLGLIVMDEEHEGSYKQETTPRYHAREVAAWRAGKEGALFLMGSATPSLEMMQKAESGEIRLLTLTSRIEERALPKVQIIDLKEAAFEQKKQVVLSRILATEIERNLKKKEGTLLLLNRRGFSTRIQCPRCGNTESCPSCQVSLTYHQDDGKLLCHYCNFNHAVSDHCSFCKAPVLRFSGFGTERVESEVARRFPGAKILRMDADTVRKKGSHDEILGQFRNRSADILIGTQMIAKGFDFPHVTLVGVILADVGLMLPDFRSSERTFQLLTQVAGRAGRGELPGRVLIQTFSPEHPSIVYSRAHDYRRFYQEEIRQRAQYFYPPYSRLINIIIRSKDEKKAYLFAREMRDSLKDALSSYWEKKDPPAVEMIGPAPLPFYKLRGHFRWHLMIKHAPLLPIPSKTLETLSMLKKPSQAAFAVDIDPLNIL